MTVTMSEIMELTKFLPRSFCGMGPQFLYICISCIAQKPYILGLVLTDTFPDSYSLILWGILCFEKK